MYSKLYRSIFDGTLYGKFEAITTFMALLALADRHGEVDVSPERLAGNLGCDVDFVRLGIEQLMAPDPYSRTPAEEGRRIVPLLNDEGKPRSFGWRIVNYLKYRAIRNEDERRAYQRDWVRQKRAERAGADRPGLGDSVEKDRHRPKSTHADADTEAVNKPTVGLAPDDAGLPPGGERVNPEAHPWDRKRAAQEAAKRLIAYLNEKAGTQFQCVESNVRLPVARMLYDDATEDDLRAVVDFKIAEAARGEFDRKYLRPATLWDAEKYAQYIGQAHARPPAAKEPTVAKVFADTGDGKPVLVTQYQEVMATEDFARRAFTEYGGVPWMRNTRDLIVHVNGQPAARFAVSELRQVA